MLSCCNYSKVVSAPGPRVYVLDGSIDLGAVRDRLEDEGFQSREYGDIEAWEKRVPRSRSSEASTSSPRRFSRKTGYLVIGAVDGIRELIHELAQSIGGRWLTTLTGAGPRSRRRRLEGTRTARRADRE